MSDSTGYRLIDHLRARRRALGTMAKGGVNLVGHLASAGLDFLIVDMMHSGVDWTELSHVCWKARAHGVYPMVRLPADPWTSGSARADRRFAVDAQRALSCGVEGLVWSVASAEDARALAHLAGDPHCTGPITDAPERARVLEAAANTRLLLPLVESRGALNELEAILDLEGISGVFMGCSDLAEVLGHPLDYLHPEVLGAVERACTAAHGRGKVVLANTGYAFDSIDGQIAHARRLEQAGVDMIMLQTVEFHVYLSTRAVAGALRAAT